MKQLRNKETGEIVTVFSLYRDEEDKIHMSYHDSKGLFKVFVTDKLGSLCETWEDVPEEPKGIQWVDVLGANDGRVVIQYNNEEEAEKAVERLRAWKRLKGGIVGWSFSYDLDLNGCGFNDEDIVVGIKLPKNAIKKDLDLLFGGEE